MIYTLGLVALIVLLYSGYNLLIKVSSDAAPTGATSLIMATVVLQLTALLTSLVFAFGLSLKGGHQLNLNASALGWAAAAGACIGVAEITYFYVYRGIGAAVPLPAGIVIPVVVAGTILVTTVVAALVLHETVSLRQMLGLLMVLIGLGLLTFR